MSQYEDQGLLLSDYVLKFWNSVDGKLEFIKLKKAILLYLQSV